MDTRFKELNSTPAVSMMLCLKKSGIQMEEKNRMRLYNVEGIDDLEGVIFARCTTLEKAKIAKKKLENEGFEDMLDIVQDEIPIDTIEIDGKFIEL